jgi:predicted amidohydrolase YtcJ
LVSEVGLDLAGATRAAARQKDLSSPNVVVTDALGMDAGSSFVEVIANRDGEILALGGKASIKVLFGTQIRDVAGKAGRPVVLPADHLTAHEEEIKEIEVDTTIVGGKIDFQR